MAKILAANVQAVIDTFRNVFGPSTDYFGSPTFGLSEDKEGVQWNAFWERHLPPAQCGDGACPGHAYIGVNLEGKKYEKIADPPWPVSTLIQRELEAPTLIENVSSLQRRDEIELRWCRDAWVGDGSR